MRVLLLALAMVVFAVRPVAAQESEPPTDRLDQAKAVYKQGADAFTDKRYKDAIDLFLQANQIAPVPAFSYNIGLAYEEMGDDASALRWYRDYARRSPKGKDLGDARERMGGLEEKLQAKGIQQVTVLSVPPGATVSVDGKPVGVTPWTGELMPGNHEATLHLRGYDDATEKFELLAHRSLDVDVQMVESIEEETSSPAPAAATSDVTGDAPADDGAKIGPATWITLGLGAATLGGALAFELMRSGAEDDARNASNQTEGADFYDTAENHKRMARILTGVGGALTVTGAILLTLDLSKSPSDEKAAIGCSGEGCAVLVRGKF